MEYLAKSEDHRDDLLRYRVGYRIDFPDGSWVARSRRYERLEVGGVKLMSPAHLRGKAPLGYCTTGLHEGRTIPTLFMRHRGVLLWTPHSS
jgi:hypothetical protein